MTQAKAQTVAAAIIGAGYNVVVRQKTPGNWVVQAQSDSVNVAVQAAADLAVTQSVTGLISGIEYS